MNARRKSLKVIAVVIVLLLSACGEKGPIIPPTATPTPTIMPTHTPTQTPTLTIKLTPTPGIGSTWARPADGMVMVYVPEGEFSMGMDADAAWETCKQLVDKPGPERYLDVEPVHTVVLDAFWIDRTEVTNAMYALCVSTGGCRPSHETSSYTRSDYYGNPEFADYPVIYVSWNDAETYCTWAGARLPTEAEWERTARGTDGRIYPWGNSSPSCSLLNSSPISTACVGDTSRVGSTPPGASPYGALDMAGNVYEWVADWYGQDYYSQSPAGNPTGPSSGDWRVLRGSPWSFNVVGVCSALRSREYPAKPNPVSGFRCARGTLPPAP